MRELKNWTEYITGEIREDEIILLGEPKSGDARLGYIWAKEAGGILETKEKREKHIRRLFAKTDKLNMLRATGVEIPTNIEELREMFRDVKTASPLDTSLDFAKIIVCEKQMIDAEREALVEKAMLSGKPVALPEIDVKSLKKRLIRRMSKHYLLNVSEMEKIFKCLDFSDEGIFGTVSIKKNVKGQEIFSANPEPFIPKEENLPEREYFTFKMKPQEQIYQERKASLIKSAKNGYIIQYQKPTVITPKFWGTRVLSSADCSKIRTFLKNNPEVETEHEPNFLELATAKSIDEYPYDPEGYYVYGALGELKSSKSSTNENILMGYCVLHRDQNTYDDWFVSDFYMDPRFKDQNVEPMLIKNASRKAWGNVYVTIPYNAEGFKNIQKYFLEAGFVLKSKNKDSETFVFQNKECNNQET